MQTRRMRAAWKGDIPKKRNSSRAFQLPVAPRTNLGLFKTDGDSSVINSYQAKSISRHHREILEHGEMRFHCRANFRNYIEMGDISAVGLSHE
jgi:hypothetical protein